MVGFMREFFKTAFFELKAKLRRRRLRRELELARIEHKVKQEIIDRRNDLIHDELATRKREEAISKHKIPNNPYEEANDE